MELALKYIDFEATKYDVQKAIEAVLHGPDLYDPEDPNNKGRVPNFSVVLKESHVGRLHAGEGTLGLPSRRLGERFLDWLHDPAHRKEGIRVCGRKLYISKSQTRMSEEHQQILENAVYIAPEQEKRRQKILHHLSERLRIARVQFGTWYRPTPVRGKVQNRIFSVEYECDYTERSEAWVEVVYDHKSIKIELGSRYTEESCKFVNVKFSSINKIAIGEEFGNPYVVFDMIVPPDFEMMNFSGATPDGVRRKMFKDRDRVCGLDDAHARVAPYSPHLRLVLFKMGDLDRFYALCRIAQCQPHPLRMDHVEAESRRFFAQKEMHYLSRWLRSMPWRDAFQVEALLRNGLLNTNDLLVDLRDPIDAVIRDFGSLASDILRLFCNDLSLRPLSETPAQCFQRVRDENVDVTPLRLAPGHFACHHITFTPTRTLLEGPYATQSNRVIRRYQRAHAPELLDNFVRVDFREEDRLPFRWDRNVDGSYLLQQRVGRILKKGFELGGRHFEFLAYSSSALRSHAVWFMSSFIDPDAKPNDCEVTPEGIRRSVLDFKVKDNEELLRQPSKLAARIALAFTATDPSVTLDSSQWEEIPDIRTLMENGGTSCHTDGVGTISPELGDMIWTVMCEASSNYRINRVKPSAYQIRFLGYKGVVVVDHRLTGVRMRLRRSQRKYVAHEVTSAPLEIARAFDYPNTAFLNRPVIMVLEDRGVRMEHLLELQQFAKRDVYTARDNLDNFRKLLKLNNLGNKFHLAFIVESLSCLGLDFKEHGSMKALGSEVFSRLLRYAINSVLRTLKHRARIPVPKSYKLVGVADEGVQYIRDGVSADDVYTLPAGRIFACIQESPEDEPVFLKGLCSISRSPVVHPGDVQRVFAIGKPPEGKICFFRGLKNAVVLPAQGPRSLADCLGGGDLDGDQFDVFINNPDLLPTTQCEPAAYPAVDPWTLPQGRTVTVEDICDFIVEYINSNVLGLLSDRHLTIADQSKQGTYDRHCMMLASMCSRAVDYAKHGVPIDLNETRLPRYLIPYKPDWHKAEVSDVRDNDYYVSERALGHLYRDITLIADDAPLEIPIFPIGPPMTDTISTALLPIVQQVLSEDEGASVESDAALISLASDLFTRYAHELRYIRSTHSLSNNPGVQLSEEEVVLGVILSTSTYRGLREDRTYRMKLHTETLIRDIREKLHKSTPDDEPGVTRAGLRRAWLAYAWAQEHREKEGATSFGLLVLGIVLDCLKILHVLPVRKEVSPPMSDDEDDEYD
ncbi:unnamed protein product [Peniophora sp. CBMAI 1063]|nr:unnamed protein product [Peniophora sp. CBMAI 1063]